MSRRSAGTVDGSLGVDFERLARFGTSTQVTIHVSIPSGTAPPRLILSSSVVEPMGLQIIPAPANSESLGRELAYTFTIAPG